MNNMHFKVVAALLKLARRVKYVVSVLLTVISTVKEKFIHHKEVNDDEE